MSQIKKKTSEYRSNNDKHVNLSVCFLDQFGLISYFMLLKAEKVIIPSLVLLATKYGEYLNLTFHYLITTTDSESASKIFCFLLVGWEGLEMCQTSSFKSMDPAYCPFFKI